MVGLAGLAGQAALVGDFLLDFPLFFKQNVLPRCDVEGCWGVGPKSKIFRSLRGKIQRSFKKNASKMKRSPCAMKSPPKAKSASAEGACA